MREALRPGDRLRRTAVPWPLPVVAILSLLSCSAHELHLADRHGLSFAPVAAYAAAHPGTTLVLWDYHHDSGVGPGFEGPQSRPASFDWVGTLVDRHIIDRVLWASGRNLLLPNGDAGDAWLERKTETLAPGRQRYLLERVKLTDSAALLAGRVDRPIVVTVDLDILTRDPGPQPEVFLKEIAAWIRAQNPALVTVSLSAAYQPSSERAWSWLEQLATTWPRGERKWILDLEAQPPAVESQEEAVAWKNWSRRPVGWRPAEGNFRPGAGVWLAAPARVRAALEAQKISAGTPAAHAVLEAWADPDLIPLETSAQGRNLSEAAEVAQQAIFDSWNGAEMPAPEGGATGWGLAIRIHEGGRDRGCLALWDGLKDLAAGARFAAQQSLQDPRYCLVKPVEAAGLVVQPSLFGPWRAMNGPTAFVVGFHSVMVVDGKKHTLIQAPLAVERAWDQAAFLDALAEKAQLGPGGWHRKDLKWFRAVTLWGEAPVTRPR